MVMKPRKKVSGPRLPALTGEEFGAKAAFFEALAESSIDGILVVDAEGRKIFQNRRLVDLLKIPPHIADDEDDEKQRRWVKDLMKEPDRFIEKVVYLYSHPDETSREELELKSGTILDRYSSPVKGKDGKFYGRIWTFRDVTTRRQAEAASERLAAIVKFSDDAIVGTNLEGNVTSWNAAAERLFGYSASEMMGESRLRIIPPDR